ncbi:ABC transporter permease [Streptomyces sp. NPDC001941]|uniref:ABC transporter permease n=1 Tax=Streptomyces sp. NPDC001941 TaxID=3154659 RepID=UPI00332D113E
MTRPAPAPRARGHRDTRLRPARLRPRDVVRVGATGLRTRPVRVVLSALGIAIGIATMVAVVGISSSSKAQLMAKLDRLGTGLLTAEPGQSLGGGQARLPESAIAMVARIGPVTRASGTGKLDVTVRRTDSVPEAESGGLGVLAAHADLADTLGVKPARGRWFTAATATYPTTVLGTQAARRLGAEPGSLVWLGERWYTVIGVLEPVELVPDLDRSALVGWPAARKYLGFDGHPTTLFERSDSTAVPDVRAVLAETANPQNPEQVKVSRPSDALAAQAAADGAFTNLLLGLGGVALLVGGVGIANTMIISVLERRAEIGLRRSIGATRGQIRTQFLTEALLLSLLGGAAGAVLGTTATYAFAALQGWTAVVPPWAIGAGMGATVAIGAIAGLYPAVRASRLSPTEALTTA